MPVERETTPEDFEAIGEPEIATAMRERLVHGEIRGGGAVVFAAFLRPFTDLELRAALEGRSEENNDG